MITHIYIANKIINFLNSIYYENLKRLDDKPLNEIFSKSKFSIIKPDFFVFHQFYLIYYFLYNISLKNTIKYSLSLHLFHIFGIIYDNLLIKYDYKPLYNLSYLKSSAYLLFIYLFFLKLIFIDMYKIKKIFMITSLFLFYLLININEIYSERIKCIENKEIFNHPLKILVITPKKDLIQKIINKTKIFTFSNFLLFINVSLYLFL
jgi:hypothetical protein